MLIGSVNHAIDAKGRYIVPSKFRADLGSSLVVTDGVNGCLFVFTLAQWEIVSRRLSELPADDDETLRLKREFFARAYDLDIDKQYRFVLPPLLRELSAISRDIVSVGMNNRLEIWGKERWEAYNSRPRSDEKQRTSLLAGVIL